MPGGGVIYILSWGGGVNSTAMLAMIKLGMLPELTKDNTHIVFANTGVEMPYTYEHTTTCLNPMVKEGWTCKWLSPHFTPEYYTKECIGLDLEDYCKQRVYIPSRINRWCTIKYKTIPVKNYRIKLCGKEYKEKSCMLLGIASEEKKRAKELGMKWTRYPLIEQDIDREGCFRLIEKAKLPTARKSGCYFCPYQRKAQWLELYRDFPDLFETAEKLEKNFKNKFADKLSALHNSGKGYYLCRDIPIRDQVKKWISKKKEKCSQFELWNEYRHCICEL